MGKKVNQKYVSQSTENDRKTQKTSRCHDREVRRWLLVRIFNSFSEYGQIVRHRDSFCFTRWIWMMKYLGTCSCRSRWVEHALYAISMCCVRCALLINVDSTQPSMCEWRVLLLNRILSRRPLGKPNTKRNKESNYALRIISIWEVWTSEWGIQNERIVSAIVEFLFEIHNSNKAFRLMRFVELQTRQNGFNAKGR